MAVPCEAAAEVAIGVVVVASEVELVVAQCGVVLVELQEVAAAPEVVSLPEEAVVDSDDYIKGRFRATPSFTYRDTRQSSQS